MQIANWAVLSTAICLLAATRTDGESPHPVTIGNGRNVQVSCLGSELPEVFYSPGEAYFEEGCSDGSCGGNNYFTSLGPRWSAGVEFTMLKPHFENNVASTTLNSDGDTFETFSDTEFTYDRELAPRVWIEAVGPDSLGFRAIYWQFDHPAATSTSTPPANGFGRISHPDFGEIDLSTTVPNSQFIANTDLNAYSVDLEVTKAMNWGNYGLLTAFGLRYAEVEQRYVAQLRSAADVLQGTINFSHQIEGIGPTIAIRTQRPFTTQMAIFGQARGSLLFGDGQSTLTAIEDQDLDDQLTTNRTTIRNDLLPIGEMQVGLQWSPECTGVFFPYVHLALEGQIWSGVGNASTEDGNLGFFGFNIAVGVDF